MKTGCKIPDQTCIQENAGHHSTALLCKIESSLS